LIEQKIGLPEILNTQKAQKKETYMISVIIANYNGARFLKGCLDSLKEQVYRDIEIIVIDNGSSDNSLEILQKYPDVKVIRNQRNLGFVGANNLGFKAAKGEYLLLLNNDTKVDSLFLEKLVERISRDKEKLGVVASKLLCMDEPNRLDAVGSFLTKYGFLYHVGFLEIDNGQYDNLKEIFSPKGVCCLISKNLLEEIGAFDESYFSYFEESDLFWRVWLSGRRIELVPESIVYHKGSYTGRRLPSDFIDYHSFKNRVCTLIKNLEFKSLCKILPVHIFLCLAISFLYLVTLRVKNSYAVIKALGWNLFHLSSTLRKRRFVQNNVRKVRDKELFKEIKKDIPLSRFIGFTKIYLERW